jgi:ABC-type oligopeptide transport system ATPase subunit
MAKEIIKARNLSVHFNRDGKLYKAVDRVDFTVNQGEILAVVGESGSGKTTLGRALLGL